MGSVEAPVVVAAAPLSPDLTTRPGVFPVDAAAMVVGVAIMVRIVPAPIASAGG